jgi:hypothetical protein
MTINFIYVILLGWVNFLDLKSSQAKIFDQKGSKKAEI